MSYSQVVFSRDCWVTGVTSPRMHDFGVFFLHNNVDVKEKEEEMFGTWVGGILIADGATPEHQALVS